MKYSFILLFLFALLFSFVQDIYFKELDLYVYYNEIIEKNFFNERWPFDIGFSLFLLTIQPIISSPEMLVISSMAIFVLISSKIFKGDDAVIKTFLLCSSFPVFVGSLNQIRATLFMLLFLAALNAKKYKSIFLTASSIFHVNSFALFSPIYLINLKFYQVILVFGVLFGSIYFNQELLYGAFYLFSSFLDSDVNLTSIFIKAIIVISLILYVSNWQCKAAMLATIFLLLTIENYAILDRYLTLSMIIVNYYYLTSIPINNFRWYKYLVFFLINFILILNSRLILVS